MPSVESRLIPASEAIKEMVPYQRPLAKDRNGVSSLETVLMTAEQNNALEAIAEMTLIEQDRINRKFANDWAYFYVGPILSKETGVPAGYYGMSPRLQVSAQERYIVPANAAEASDKSYTGDGTGKPLFIRYP